MKISNKTQYVNPNKFWKRKFYNDFRFYNEKVPKNCDWKKMYMDTDNTVKVRNKDKKFELFFELPAEIIFEILCKVDCFTLKNFSLTAKSVKYKEQEVDIKDFTAQVWKTKRDCVDLNFLLSFIEEREDLLNQLSIFEDEKFMFIYKQKYFHLVFAALMRHIEGKGKVKKYMKLLDFIVDNRKVLQTFYYRKLKNVIFEKLVLDRAVDFKELYTDWYLYKIYDVRDFSDAENIYSKIKDSCN
jgi:hypothetical protein